MFDVRLMRKEGFRLPREEACKLVTHSGEFVLDVAYGAKRLRIKNPWSGGYASVELYEPVLVAAHGGALRFRGYERVGEQGVVQEWHVRLRG